MLNLMSELKSAGINEPGLISSYLECRRLNAKYGKTYFLATKFLPKGKRPFVHALYGFARYADEIVDNFEIQLSSKERSHNFKEWRNKVENDLNSNQSEDLVLKALIHTKNLFGIDSKYFQAFLNSMEMDLTVSSYDNYQELSKYVYGSASVIGLQMVPILGTSNLSEANVAAEKLGTAFQLANFIRDVGEDIDRGRIYMPLDELISFGVEIQSIKEKRVTPALVSALKFQISRVRKLQSEAANGIKYLNPESRPCIEAASELYCGIVDEVEKIDFQIFNRRAKTSNLRRLRVAIPAYLKTVKTR